MRILSVVLLLICSSSLRSQPNVPQEVGEVSFANSGAAAAQPEFLRGLAQLHNFEYEDAAAHFHAAQAIDPGFALAYWGEAMTYNHGIWHEQDLGAARKVLARLGATPAARLAKAPTAREKQYLASIEVLYGQGSKDERDQKYAAAMAKLHQQYPDDVDATALYALAILSSVEHGRDFATYMRAAAVLEEAFPSHPHHPGVVHYLIHSYDDPIHAPLGLRPARIYAQLAPSAAHAQHMTSHIFLALGRWDDVVKANETAMGVVNHHLQLAGRPASFCGHYNEWLEYAYLQLGRVAEARHILEGCREEATREVAEQGGKVETTSDPDTSTIYSYAEMRAHFLINSELWQDEVAHWSLPPGDFPFAQLTFDYADTLVAFETSQYATAQRTLARLELDAKRAIAWLDREQSGGPIRSNITIAVEQMRALLGSQSPHGLATAVALQRVAEKEEALPLEFGPPAICKPTEELLGEIYLRRHQSAEAIAAFTADLGRAPGRRLGTRGLELAQK